MCLISTRAVRVQSLAGSGTKNFTSPVTFGGNVNNPRVHLTSLGLISSDTRTTRNSRTNFNVEGENDTGYRYITHLYCLAVQAGFYSDAVERWSFVRRVAGSIIGLARTDDSFLRLLHLAPPPPHPLHTDACFTETPCLLKYTFSTHQKHDQMASTAYAMRGTRILSHDIEVIFPLIPLLYGKRTTEQNSFDIVCREHRISHHGSWTEDKVNIYPCLWGQFNVDLGSSRFMVSLTIYWSREPVGIMIVSAYRVGGHLSLESIFKAMNLVSQCICRRRHLIQRCAPNVTGEENYLRF